MAKRPPKEKNDNLRVALRHLARADKEAARALRNLCIAVQNPVQEPDFEYCAFAYDGEEYNFFLTSNQSKKIRDVAAEGGNVQQTVSDFLSPLTSAAIDGANALLAPLGIPTKKSAIAKGCCKYDGIKSPGLTQSQCLQYTGSTWDSTDPTCQGKGKP